MTPPNYDPATTNPWGLHPRLLPQRVEAQPGLVPGDVHVDATAQYLYHIEEGGTAMRYGMAIGRGGLYEPGIYTIRRKVEWPHWTPTQDMIRREPETYAQYGDGMEPGPRNALGSRALPLRRRPRHLPANPRHAVPALDRLARQLRLRPHGHGAHQRPLRAGRDRGDRLSLPRCERRPGDGAKLIVPQVDAYGSPWLADARVRLGPRCYGWSDGDAGDVGRRVTRRRSRPSPPHQRPRRQTAADAARPVQIARPSSMRSGSMVVSTGPTWRYQ